MAETGGAVQLGTTIIAVQFDGGVVLGADSRTTTGTYVANRVTNKITALCDNVYILRSGSAADTQAISRYVEHMLDQHSTSLDEPGTADVKTAANLVMQIAYNNKNNLSAGMIVAGWDRHLGGQVYGVPLGGSLLRLPYAMGGSGSSYIYTWMDSSFKEGMTREEAEKFVLRGLTLAMARDGSSGGCARLVTITEAGAERQVFLGDKVYKGYDELVEP